MVVLLLWSWCWQEEILVIQCSSITHQLHDYYSVVVFLWYSRRETVKRSYHYRAVFYSTSKWLLLKKKKKNVSDSTLSHWTGWRELLDNCKMLFEQRWWTRILQKWDSCGVIGLYRPFPARYLHLVGVQYPQDVLLLLTLSSLHFPHDIYESLRGAGVGSGRTTKLVWAASRV